MNALLLRVAPALLGSVLIMSCSSATDGFGGANQAGPPPPPPGSPNAVLTGDWGGAHAALNAAAAGATVEFDCAQGSLMQPVQLDAQGRFDAPGVLIVQQGGPAAPPDSGEAARYVGQVSGKLLTLTVVVTTTGETRGPFALTLGATPRLVPCS